MSIKIEGGALLYVQYGNDCNLELRVIFSYYREALIYLQSAKIEDFISSGDGKVRLFLVCTQNGDAVTKLLIHGADLTEC